MVTRLPGWMSGSTEIAQSCHLLRQAADELAGPAAGTTGGGRAAAGAGATVGRDVGWAEAPQGEVLYDVRYPAGGSPAAGSGPPRFTTWC